VTFENIFWGNLLPIFFVGGGPEAGEETRSLRHLRPLSTPRLSLRGLQVAFSTRPPGSLLYAASR
jgi:hypothetical protein